MRNHSSTPPGILPKWTVTTEALNARRITLRVDSLTPAEAADLAAALKGPGNPSPTEVHLWDVWHDRGDVCVLLRAELLDEFEASRLAKELDSTAREALRWRSDTMRSISRYPDQIAIGSGRGEH